MGNINVMRESIKLKFKWNHTFAKYARIYINIHHSLFSSPFKEAWKLLLVIERLRKNICFKEIEASRTVK